MDKTETYIKMCEKAEEIQLLRPIELEGEFISLDGEGFQCGEYGSLPRGVVWLPRQDQLQAMMVHCHGLKTIEGFVRFTGTLSEGEWFIKPEFYDLSMEQIWLSFVMKEKYEKVWNGDDWIKEG